MPIIMPRAGMTWAAYRLGLAPGLKLSLDAGDDISAAAGAQSWFDMSGNGSHFWLGSSSSMTASDPTLSGTPGRFSSSEYFSFDGGDYFTRDTLNPSWVQGFHKDSAKFSLATWMYFGALTGSQYIFADCVPLTNTGFAWRLDNSTPDRLTAFAGSGTAQRFEYTGTVTLVANAWHFLALTIDEAANAGQFAINNSIENFAVTYTSPSTSDAAEALRIGARGDGGGTPLANGSRIHCMQAWDQRVLSAGELRALFLATRGKFGV